MKKERKRGEGGGGERAHTDTMGQVEWDLSGERVRGGKQKDK